MKNLFKVSAVVLAVLATGTVSAATQGNLAVGPTKAIQSQGSFDVKLNVGHVIEVNNLDDINFGDFNSGLTAGGDLSLTDKFCVFGNNAAFRVTMLGGNVAGFEMDEDTNAALRIPYTVQLATVNQATGVTGAFGAVAHNVPVVNITEKRNRRNCNMPSASGVSFKPNLEVKVTVAEAALLDAVPGSYKDTVTVIASPE